MTSKTKKHRNKFGQFKKTPYLCIRFRDLAQLVAHTSGGREVAGSSPVIPTERKKLTTTGFEASFVVVELLAFVLWLTCWVMRKVNREVNQDLWKQQLV